MRISTIPQIYRHLHRWREILAVLSKYGLADWASRLGLTFGTGLLRNRQGTPLINAKREERIRLALEELGPTFIKLGQVLSTRPDQVGFELAEELSKLQASAPVTDSEQVLQLIEKELGRPIEECFLTFEHQPVASASIGQVHQATLPDGTLVAVKVQHPDLERRVRVDLEILAALAQLAQRLPELRAYRLPATVAELRRMLSRELDFDRERRNLQAFARQFKRDDRVVIPRSYADWSTQRVLTMQWLEGIKLSQLARSEGVEREELASYAQLGAEIYLKMIFEEGFYHADPHPGNLVLLPSGAIGLFDFGMVGRLEDSLRERVEDLLVAIASRDSRQLVNVVMRIGSPPQGLDDTALAAELTEFVEHYAYQTMDHFDLAGALNEFLAIVRRYQIQLPSSIALLIKVLVMLEGMARMLQPDFCLMELIEPYRHKIAFRRLSPRRQARKMRTVFGELEELAEIAPRRLREILEQVQRGKFDVHLDHRGLEPSVNRLALGMLTSALILGSSLLVSRDVGHIYGVPVPGIVGYLLSGWLGFRLLRAIGKSGRLDRKE